MKALLYKMVRYVNKPCDVKRQGRCLADKWTGSQWCVNIRLYRYTRNSGLNPVQFIEFVFPSHGSWRNSV